MPYNYRTDPRFQRARLAAQARARFGQRVPSGLAGAFVGQQAGRGLAFQRLGLQRQLAEARLQAGREQLGLGRARLGLGRRALREERRALPLQIGLGAATALWATREGRRRAQETRALAQAQQRHWAEMEKYMARR